MTLLQPPESKIKAAVKLHYDGVSRVKKANLEPSSHLWGIKEGDEGIQNRGIREMDEGYFLWETNLILFHHL